MALWLYVTRQQSPAVAYDYQQPLPVSTAYVPQGLQVTNNLGSVRVRIRVDSSNTPVTPGSFQTFVDLTNVKPGVHRVPVEVVPDPGIHVTQIVPSFVTVRVAPIITRHVPVRARILASPPYGYNYQSVNLQPTTVSITGQKDVVYQVARVSVYLDLSQARSTVVGLYRPYPENSQGAAVSGRVQFDYPQIHVTVPVIALSSYKTLPVLVSVKGRPAAGVGVVGIIAHPAYISASGAPSALSRLSAAGTSPVVVSGKAHNFRGRVQLRLPKGVSSRSRAVTVDVQLAPLEASTTIQVAVAPRNAPLGTVVRTQPAYLLVSVIGPSSGVRSAARAMRASIDLTGYAPGTYQLKPSITVPRGFSIEGFYPSTVTAVVGPGAATG